MGERLEATAEQLKHRMKNASSETKLDCALACLKEQRDVIDLILSIFEEEEEKTKCPLCGGEGTNVHFVERANVAINTRCERCGGKGYLEGEEELGHKPPE